jgi:hypothetical protein
MALDLLWGKIPRSFARNEADTSLGFEGRGKEQTTRSLVVTGVVLAAALGGSYLLLERSRNRLREEMSRKFDPKETMLGMRTPRGHYEVKPLRLWTAEEMNPSRGRDNDEGDDMEDE